MLSTKCTVFNKLRNNFRKLTWIIKDVKLVVLK